MNTTDRPTDFAHTPTLFRHLLARYVAAGRPGADRIHGGDEAAFSDFCDAEMARNPVSFTGYADAGLTVTLVDGTSCLLAPSRLPEAQRAGSMQPSHDVAITRFGRGGATAPGEGGIPIGGG